MAPTETDIRNTILISDTTVLTSAQITLATADAVADCPVSDERAIRYLTCYILADRIDWDKVESAGGIKFKKPNPENFHKQYRARLRNLGRGKFKKSNYEKTIDPQEY